MSKSTWTCIASAGPRAKAPLVRALLEHAASVAELAALRFAGLLDQVDQMVVDLGFVVEATEDDEMPEQVRLLKTLALGQYTSALCCPSRFSAASASRAWNCPPRRLCSNGSTAPKRQRKRRRRAPRALERFSSQLQVAPPSLSVVQRDHFASLLSDKLLLQNSHAPNTLCATRVISRSALRAELSRVQSAPKIASCARSRRHPHALCTAIMCVITSTIECRAKHALHFLRESGRGELGFHSQQLFSKNLTVLFNSTPRCVKQSAFMLARQVHGA